MVNSGSFDSDGQGDRNAKVGCTQPHNTSDSTQSSSPVTASAATSCKTDFSQTADSDLPSVAHAIEPTPTKTEFNCDMPVENFTNLSSVDGTVEESEKSPVSASEDEKTSLCCSLPLDKVQGMLTPYHPSATKADDDGTKVKQPTRKLLCLYCDRSFVSANLRQKHVERIHSAKQNRRFSSRRQNQLTVTPCVYCDKINGTENTLKDLFQHLINEHSSKYFGCLPCEDRFLTSSLLADHNASKHSSSTSQSSSNLETSTGPNKTTIKMPRADDVKVEAEVAAEEVPIKLTRSRMKPKPEENGKGKKAILGNKKKSTKLKEMRTKKLSIKSSRIALKRRESKRLQAIAKIAESQKKKRPKPGIEKKQSNVSKTEPTNSTKMTEKTKSNSTCINPYPEFDHFYRVKKITDHSIDNLKISSLTFDDVFDKAFFNRIKCNIEENLLHHIDGKLFKNEESESRISNFEKVSNVPQEIQNSSSENYGCELSLNAVTPVASLSLNSQFGEDFESQIEYGSKPSKKKTQTRKDEIHYKYFTRRKYQASILEHKENRDLSKLDMWTQLVIKKRQQKILDEKKSAKEILEYTTCDEYKNKMQRLELNRILDRRGPFEDLKEEASKKAALDKLNSASEDSISQESFTEVRQVLNEILNRVFAVTDEVTAEVDAGAEKAATCSNKKPDLREVPSYLNLRRSSSLPSDGEIDKSDKITLICSSQETENFELPTNQVRGKHELIELTGEWARSRMYICAACGAKLPNMKYLLEHKSLYHQNVWVQHYEFVGNQSKLYRHLSIPALGKVGAVEESVQCKLWRRSDARVCTKCGKQCNALGELHRHILECGGDWTWMLARKKCKYRPFGAKSRRKRRGLVHRFHHKQKTEPAEKKTYKKAFDGPRQRPSDADTIQRMLANLPAKRSTRKLISLQDGIYRARKKSQINNINQNKIKCGKVIYKSSGRKETTEKTINTSVSVTGKKQKSIPSSSRKSLRSLNKVLASRILDTNTKLSVKRKIKVLHEQRRTRRSQFLLEEVKETIIEETPELASVSPPPTKIKTKLSSKKENKEILETEPETKRSSPRSSPKNVKKKMSVKKLLTGKINIKSFFPVKKRKNRKTLTENQTPKDTDTEVENTDVNTRSKRKSKDIADIDEEKKEVVIPKIENKKTKNDTFSSLVRSLSIHKKKTKNMVQDKTAEPTINTGVCKRSIMTSNDSKNTDTDEQVLEEKDKKAQNEKTSKKRKLKCTFRNVINKVKKLKIDNTPVNTVEVELPQNQKNHSSAFLEESKPDDSIPPAQPEKIVIPSILEVKENTADISIPAPIVMDFHETNENPPIPETIFKLESNNEKSLQAKGELDFDSCPNSINNINTEQKQTLLSAGTETAIEHNEKTKPISIEISTKPKIVPLISPNMKGKIRKPVRGLNDCIAMLTSKLQQKIEEKPVDSIFALLSPNTINQLSPKSECILRIPTFKTQNIYSEVEETALDLSTKSSSNSDLSEKQKDCALVVTTKDTIAKEVTEVIEQVPSAVDVNVDSAKAELPYNKTHLENVFNSVDRIIEEVVENKTQANSQIKWNSIDETIQKVIENQNPVESKLYSRNTIDDIIDFVVEYGNDNDISKIKEIKTGKALEKFVRKIGSVRKPKNKKYQIEAAKLEENIDSSTPEEIENSDASTTERTVEEKVDGIKSNVENASGTTVKRTNSLKKKKTLEIVCNGNTTETKPKKAIAEKTTKSNVKILDDKVEKNKSTFEEIDVHLNEAFIDTPETATGKTSSVKNKKGTTRKVGQARSRSGSKKCTATQNRPSDKTLLETNLDTMLNVKEVNPIAEISASQNIFIGNETTMTKDEEIKQLSNEDEPHLLENKIMTQQSKFSISSSDSEDDLPLTALLKSDESVRTKCTENKIGTKMEGEVKDSSNKDDANLLIETNTHIDESSDVPKKVTKRRSNSIKKKNEYSKVVSSTIETSSVDINTFCEITPVSAVENKEYLDANVKKVAVEPEDHSKVTKKRSRSLKNTSKAENIAVNVDVVNGEEQITEDIIVTEKNLGKKVQKRKSGSGKGKTESTVSQSDLLKQNVDDIDTDTPLETSIDSNVELNKVSDVKKKTKPFKKKSGNVGNNAQKTTELEMTDNAHSDDLQIETDVKSNDENNQTNSEITDTEQDCNKDFVELMLENQELPKKSLKELAEDVPNENVVANSNINPDLEITKTKHVINILDSVESEVKKTAKKRGRPPKKKIVNSEIDTTLQSSSSSSENTAINNISADADTNSIEHTDIQTETIEEFAKNILLPAEPVIAMKKPGKGRPRSLKKKNSDKGIEGATFPSLINEKIGVENSNKKEDIDFIEETDIQIETTEGIIGNVLGSPESVAEIKKPAKRRSRSPKNKNVSTEPNETSLKSNITSLSEDIGIGSTNEEVESNLIEPQVEFAEPEVKPIKVTRKRSKSVKSKDSAVGSPIVPILSDFTLNSSEDFGENSSTEQSVIVAESNMKKLSKRRSRSQKSQGPLEEDEKLSNILTDTLLLDVDASVLNENVVESENTDKEIRDTVPQPEAKIAKKRRSRSLKSKSTTIEGFLVIVPDQSLNGSIDVSKDPMENTGNRVEEMSKVEAKLGEIKTKKTPKRTKGSKATDLEVISSLTEYLESNTNNVTDEIVDETNDKIDTEFVDPVVQDKKRKRLRSVRKKPVMDCIDNEDENSDSFINNAPIDNGKVLESNILHILSSDSASDCVETKKTNKKSRPINSKNASITTTMPINGLSITDDLIEAFIDSLSSPNPLDEIIKDVGSEDNIKPKLKQRRSSLKNTHKTKNKRSKAISPQVANKKQAEQVENVNSSQSGALNQEGENLKVVSADTRLESEKTNESVSSNVETPKENSEPPNQTEPEKTTDLKPVTNEMNESVESSSKNCEEPPIKIIINKQKTRRKSKSFKKVDLKGQNDLFEDFALVIKKPKRIAPIITYTPADTFSKDTYPNYIKKPIEQAPPVPTLVPEKVMEEIPPDLDASVEEMDMELDEIPITSNIIENLSFTTAPPVTNLFGKTDLDNLIHPLIVPKEGNALIVPEKRTQITKKRGRPAKNKTLKNIQNEELFQPVEKDLPLTTELDEGEFLYETNNRRSTRSKSIGDVVQETETPSRKSKLKTNGKNSLEASFELAEDINKFSFIPEKLKDSALQQCSQENLPVSPTNKFIDKTIESVENIFNFISGIGNEEEERANIAEESLSNKKQNKFKYNNKKEMQADLEEDPKLDFGDLNDFVVKEVNTVESSSNSNETKPKRNKRKKSKSNTLEGQPVKEAVNVNSTPKVLNQNPLFNKEKDIDSIYAFTEFDDLEIDLPIEKPKRIPRKQTKSLSESMEHFKTDNLKDDNILVDSTCDTSVVTEVTEDLQKDLKPDKEDNFGEETVSKPVTKRKSRSGREISNTNPDSKEESQRTGEIKENNISIDVPENGRRKSIRSAKVKALEHIHDDALAELTESERNRDLDKDKIIPCEENLSVSDELSKKKSNKKHSKAQNTPKLPDLELPKESTEDAALLTELTADLEELEKSVEKELNEEEIISYTENNAVSDELIKKKSNKKPTKAQKVQKLRDDLDPLQEDAKEIQLLTDLAADLTGLEELENSIERELNMQMEVKKKTKKVKDKLPKPIEDSEIIIPDDPNMEAVLKNDLLVEENNQELRRSRRGSRKIASYNENDLVDPLLDEIDGKRKNRRKDRAEEGESVAVIESKVIKKTKESDKKLNSDELFDLLKASSKENIYVPKPPNSFLSNLEESSRDFNEENFENVFENILEKSTFLIQNNVIDKNKEEKDIDKIYEFTESPESIDQIKDDISLPECKRKTHKKFPRRNVSPSKSQAEDNSDSMLNIPIMDTFSIPSTPDLHDSSVDSKSRTIKSDKVETLDKTNYCEICNKSFIRIENLIKHKRTLTHIQKLSEIEAKEAAKKSNDEHTQNESSKTSDSIIEITSDSSKVTSDLSKADINISDILQESNKPNEEHSAVVHSSFTNNHSLKLADIINDVLNKPVLECDNEKHNSFSDIIMQNNTEVQPEYRRYKSLGERKSFDSEPTEPQTMSIAEPYVSKTTILEKQISLLENIIENQTGVNYIDDISMSSSNSLEHNILENNSARASPSELSLKQDDSSNIIYTRNNLMKPNTDDSFLKPSQYEEISEDSINLRSYEDQKLRKTLNRDEELFLECCSLLKSGSEVSSYSNKKSHNKILNTMGLKQCDEPEWLERKSLVQKPLYEVAHDYSDDNSRIPTPLGDSYDDDASNSNTISSNWNMNKKVPVFEDISQDKGDPENKSFTFEEVLNEYEDEGKNKSSVSKFGGILSKTINNQIDAVHKIIRKPLVDAVCDEEISEKKQEELSDGSTSDSKKIITKGARKVFEELVFEGLKVSIPTEELNLEEVLNCSPKSKKMEIVNIQNFVENAKLAQEPPSPQSKPSRTARKSKPVKNKSQFGSNLLFKMNKKKVLSPTGMKKKDEEIKTHDIYDFEETQDNSDVFTKPDFRTFRNMKSSEIVPEPESDTESRDYLDSFSVEGQSITSSVSSSSSRKPKTQENITKKKCMIMGRIFKNAAKSKIEDIDEEIRDIPALDNDELVQSYVANCKKIIKNEEVAKPKLSENEINQLFDQLLENRLENQETVHSDTRNTVKSKSDIRKADSKRKIKAKNRKRTRTNSESTDDEFSLNKTKKRAYRKNAKAEDNCINLEQELKECIGVASRKSQRKCTSGKQNVLVEYWSSDDSQFEALLESQRIESRQSNQTMDEDKNSIEIELALQSHEDLLVEVNITDLSKSTVSETSERPHKPKNTDKKPQQKRKLSSERKPKSVGAVNGKTSDTATSNRRKRAAANPLYHWSSSSEDESQDLIEVKPIRDELEDDEDRPVQHGWIVGDSPKKLVTMLAQAKGKKTDIDCVKEQGKKRTNAVS